MEKSLEKVLTLGSKNLYKCCLCEGAKSSLRTKSVIQQPFDLKVAELKLYKCSLPFLWINNYYLLLQ